MILLEEEKHFWRYFLFCCWRFMHTWIRSENELKHTWSLEKPWSPWTILGLPWPPYPWPSLTILDHPWLPVTILDPINLPWLPLSIVNTLELILTKGYWQGQILSCLAQLRINMIFCLVWKYTSVVLNIGLEVRI